MHRMRKQLDVPALFIDALEQDLRSGPADEAPEEIERVDKHTLKVVLTHDRTGQRVVMTTVARMEGE